MHYTDTTTHLGGPHGGRGRGPRGAASEHRHGGHRFRHDGFGAGPGFAGPRGLGGRGSRARKGDVRTAILSLLAEAPSNGYGLIKAIAEKTDGAWRPSPGSVYPTLAQLVDEELAEPTGDAGPRSQYRLTDTGRNYVSQHADQIANAWSAVTAGSNEQAELFTAARKLMGAVRQVGIDATAEQRRHAATKLDELRRDLYRILGE